MITYSYKLTNTGNVILFGPFSVSDDKLGTVVCPPAPTSLAPTQSVTCTQTYAIKQSDLDNGSITNSATATNGATTSPPDTVTINATQLTVEKSSLTTSLSAPGKVSYSYLVTNNGEVTLTGINLTDNNDNNDMTCPKTTLAPTETMTCSATHTFSQAELDANGSPVAGSGALTNTVTAGSNEAPPASDNLSIPILQGPALSVDKSASPTTYDHAGEVITYTYVITNSGNVTLAQPFTITDDKLGTITCPATPATLAPTETITCTKTYTIKQADLDNGSITNTATGDERQPPTSPPDTETIFAEQSPGLSLDKSATPGTYVHAGEVITYTYVITNSGNVTLAQPFTITDDKLGHDHLPGDAGDARADRDDHLHQDLHDQASRRRRGLDHEHCLRARALRGRGDDHVTTRQRDSHRDAGTVGDDDVDPQPRASGGDRSRSGHGRPRLRARERHGRRAEAVWGGHDRLVLGHAGERVRDPALDEQCVHARCER